MKKFYCWIFILCSVFMTGCGASTYAPVIDGWHESGSKQNGYRVQEGDTLYSIAWGFDTDFRDLAAANHLTPPYAIHPGQILRMPSASEINTPKDLVEVYAIKNTTSAHEDYIETSSPTVPSTSKNKNVDLELPVIKKETKTNDTTSQQNEVLQLPTLEKMTGENTKSHVAKERSHFQNLEEPSLEVVVSSHRWQWPVRGRITRNFSLQPGGNKGIDIAGHLNDVVKATAGGRVVYSGSGLKGYGNLLIIKHSDSYLSAYGYNRKLLVKEGQRVSSGQAIANMGQSSSGEVVLHFEIRHNGKPVNPLRFLN